MTVPMCVMTGMASIVIPVYLTELATASLRGTISIIPVRVRKLWPQVMHWIDLWFLAYVLCGAGNGDTVKQLFVSSGILSSYAIDMTIAFTGKHWTIRCLGEVDGSGMH